MKRIKRFLKTLGPGFITGASDDDPSGIGTYSQTGSLFGFAQLWTALFSFPMMASVQEMCGRIGLVTGHGLAGVLRKYYSQKLLSVAVLLLVVANTINIGADLGAMAASAQLIFNIHFVFLLLFMVILTLTFEIFISYKTYSKYLKYLTFSLFAYVITAFVVKVDWQKALISSLVPYFVFTKEYLLNIVAIFGTTISPYLFFWQANQEVEEEIEHHKLRSLGAGIPKITPKDVSSLRIDTIVGMFFSNAVMWFIIITTGSTLHPSGILNIQTANQAALALRPAAGDFAFLLFAGGIIGTGLLAVPILSGSASYAVSEAFNWHAGFSLKLKKAHGFYGVIAVATVAGLVINFIGINPIQALYYTAVVNGVIAPPLLLMIILIANNKRIMGKYVNTALLNVLGIATVAIMSIAAIGLFLTL